MRSLAADLVFVPLGGVGEIGMNAGLYGYGDERRRKWLMVDCGVTFAEGDDTPGIDLILPDIRFAEAERRNIVGLVLTHAHEDHFGALLDLWPRLRVPVWATPFAAALLDAKRRSEPNAPDIDVRIVPVDGRITIAPFDVEFVPVAHSIPESTALAIRTPAGLVVHTGDWKLDDTPVVGRPTDEARMRQLGEEGVAAVIGDSTNAIREGRSPSESDVARSLADIIRKAPARVAVTTFASNVGRLRAVAEAALAADRNVVIVGRSMQRIVTVARETGYLEGIPQFLGPDSYGYLPRDKVVALLTGSQGEPRAALARVARDDHPEIALAPGDMVIFSSRTIPGNEKAVGGIVNGLVEQGIEIVTDGKQLVHVSGHPRRGEIASLYSWLKPQLVLPVHGEALHLTKHAAFARSLGVPKTILARNGQMVRIAGGRPEIVDEVLSGRLYKDGSLLVPSTAPVIAERRRLAYVGVATVALALSPRGDLLDGPDVRLFGVPETSANGTHMLEIAREAVLQTLEGLPKQRRRDRDFVETAIERAVRSAVGQAWGKKPHTQVVVLIAD